MATPYSPIKLPAEKSRITEAFELIGMLVAAFLIAALIVFGACVWLGNQFLFDRMNAAESRMTRLERRIETLERQSSTEESQP